MQFQIRLSAHERVSHDLDGDRRSFARVGGFLCYVRLGGGCAVLATVRGCKGYSMGGCIY